MTLVQADMRTCKLEERFSLAILAANSFLGLLTPNDQRRTLTNIHRHLQAGGRLAIHIFVPDVAIIAADAGSASNRPLRYSGEFLDPLREQRIVVWESRRYDTSGQRLHARYVYERLDQNGVVIERRHRDLDLCYVWPNEMQYLLELCGFEVEALYGGFEREPFGPDSRTMVWVARKPADT